MPLHRVTTLLLVFIQSIPISGQLLVRHVFEQQKMGTQFRVTIYAPDEFPVEKISDVIWARVDSLNLIFSDYEANSELSQLSATAGGNKWISISEELWTVLNFSNRLAALTSGTFDVTIGPLSKLWRRAIRRQSLPTNNEILNAKALIGYDKILLDSAARRVQLIEPGMRLDLGGVAKGFTVDQIARVLRAWGIQSFLVDGGGDLLIADAPPGAIGWKIQLEEEDQFRTLSNTAVAASGNAYKYVEVDGRRYGHIVDPQTGYGSTKEETVFVTAPDCMTADALASVVSLSSSEYLKQLIPYFQFRILK